jgi:diguanylate cyclase (GGDEF)-like protein
LPNRHLLQERASAMLRDAASQGHQVALIFIDLDKFKLINDTLGHPVGDTVLVEVARRFAALVSPNQLLARWGGDEFVLVMPIASAEEAARQTQQLAQALRRPFQIDRDSHPLGMSAGIACYPADGKSVTELLRCADTAMYQAKQDGRGEYCFFEDRMNLALTQFVQIEQALRQTLAQEGSGLSLLFQPQLDISGKTLVGVEVLTRWQHPALGEITPRRLIHVAEESGQIAALSHRLIRLSLQKISDLRRSLGSGLPFSINLSTLQIADKSLPRQLRLACLEYDLACADLTLEISESTWLANEADCLESVLALKSLGFRIAIDDLTSGYAALNSVEKIRPDEIKLDPRLVANLPNDSEAKEIILFTQRMADALTIRTVIKGVETAAQWQALQDMGNCVLQGFHLAAPLDGASLIDFSRQHQPDLASKN